MGVLEAISGRVRATIRQHSCNLNGNLQDHHSQPAESTHSQRGIDHEAATRMPRQVCTSSGEAELVAHDRVEWCIGLTGARRACFTRTSARPRRCVNSHSLRRGIQRSCSDSVHVWSDWSLGSTISARRRQEGVVDRFVVPGNVAHELLVHDISILCVLESIGSD